MLKQGTNRASGQGDDWKVDISNNARVVLEKRYLRKDRGGRIIETPEQMFRRVAAAIARPEPSYGSSPEASQEWEGRFYDVMSRLEFVPNSPTLMNAGINQDDGTGSGTLSACFVMGLEDSMDGIMTTAKEMAMVQKFGGGTRLRPFTDTPAGHSHPDYPRQGLRPHIRAEAPLVGLQARDPGRQARRRQHGRNGRPSPRHPGVHRLQGGRRRDPQLQHIGRRHP